MPYAKSHSAVNQPPGRLPNPRLAITAARHGQAAQLRFATTDRTKGYAKHCNAGLFLDAGLRVAEGKTQHPRTLRTPRQLPFANFTALRHNGCGAPGDYGNLFPPGAARRLMMFTDNYGAMPADVFRQTAAATGLDTSDEARMADLQRRVALMRQGLARLNEIDVAGAESPSVFVPSRPPAGR